MSKKLSERLGKPIVRNGARIILEHQFEELQALEKKVEELKAKNKKLIDRINRIANKAHDINCPVWDEQWAPAKGECTCGLDELIQTKDG